METVKVAVGKVVEVVPRKEVVMVGEVVRYKEGVMVVVVSGLGEVEN